MLPATSERVPQSTAPHVNEMIRRKTEESVRWHAAHPDCIDQRLEELDREWDIERVLEANASALAFSGVVLGAMLDRRWLLLPALVTGFLFQHALQGWCPPVPLLRRIGVRTAREIAVERFALKALRGDYGPIANAPDRSAAAMRAVEA
jgi:hypothetical protein